MQAHSVLRVGGCITLGETGQVGNVVGASDGVMDGPRGLKVEEGKQRSGGQFEEEDFKLLHNVSHDSTV